MKNRIPTLCLGLMVAFVLVGSVLGAGCTKPTTTTPPTTTPAQVTPSTPATTPPSTPATPVVSGLELGKMIYETGADNTGMIAATDGIPTIKVNACKNCHGVDAKGGKKLNIPAPDIRGSVLQPDFDEAKFARAVTTGIDDGGKRLHKQMPRFSATPEDTAALWTYLNSLK